MRKQTTIVKLAVLMPLALVLVFPFLLIGCAKDEVPGPMPKETVASTSSSSTIPNANSTSTLSPSLDADFSASPLEIKAGETVRFSHVPKGGSPPYSCEWDFNNDGTVDSTEANPRFAYSEPGPYTVSLKVTDAKQATDTEIKHTYVSVHGVVNMIMAPGDFPTGLTWDGEYLWNADYNSEEIYKIDPDDGRVVKTLEAPSTDPEGLAWDGTYIWHVDGGNAFRLGCEGATLQVYKIDPETGVAVSTFEAPGPGCNAEDLAWDGEYLWYLDGSSEAEQVGTSSISMVDPESGEVVKKLDAPGTRPSGIAWGGSYMWLSDYMGEKIYKIDVDDGRVIASYNAPSSYPSGLAWDGTYLWCADWQSAKIYKIYFGL